MEWEGKEREGKGREGKGGRKSTYVKKNVQAKPHTPAPTTTDPLVNRARPEASPLDRAAVL